MYERILLADDAPFMRMILKNVLEKNDFEICGEAEDGFEVVEKYDELQPDVLILGLVLPKMDGMEVLRKVIADYSDAKIIICSSMSRESYVVDALKNGAFNFIAKPFQAETLVNAVMKAANDKEPAAILSKNILNDWCAKQINYKPGENITQEQIDKIVDSYHQLCAILGTKE